MATFNTFPNEPAPMQPITFIFVIIAFRPNLTIYRQKYYFSKGRKSSNIVWTVLSLYYILMGGQQSKKKAEIINIIDSYKFGKEGAISEKQFTKNIFKVLDNDVNHTKAGPIYVTDTHIIKAFYDLLTQQNKGVLSKSRLNEIVQKMYSKPETSIEYSYLIISRDSNRITKQDFTDFVANSLDKAFQLIFRIVNFEHIFKKSFMEWVNTNRPKLLAEIEGVFNENALSNSAQWTRGDFKRWILNREHWSLIIEIKQKTFKIPLNIACLFGVKLDKDQ